MERNPKDDALCFFVLGAALMVIALAIVILGVLPTKPPAGPDGQASFAGILQRYEFSYSEEGSVSVPGEAAYQLKLDIPFIFDKGSKSERIAETAIVLVPEDLKGKTEKLVGSHVVVTGTLDCKMLYSPWTAACELTASRIDALD